LVGPLCFWLSATWRKNWIGTFRLFAGLGHLSNIGGNHGRQDLNDLFLDTLKDIYYAEKQIYKSLPKMAKAAQSDPVTRCVRRASWRDEGPDRTSRTNFPNAGQARPRQEMWRDRGPPRRRRGNNRGNNGRKGTPALDAGLLAVEHYDISRYGTLKTWAGNLDIRDAVQLLDETLTKEKNTDDARIKLATSAVSAEAVWYAKQRAIYVVSPPKLCRASLLCCAACNRHSGSF